MKELRDLRAPNEDEAQERTWRVVRAAFVEREPIAPRRRVTRPLLAFAVLAALVAAALSPPGRAVLDNVREAIGIEGAQTALFSLPAPGHLLVSSDAGSWVVAPDGSKRFLGGYREASWSPFGRFVVAARQNEIAALEPNGDVRWTLARPNVNFPRWGGTRSDTRIAYLTGRRLHVVAGDGTGDVDAGGMPGSALVAPAWLPGGRPHVVAYVTFRGRVRLYEPDSGALRWQSAPYPTARKLLWSPNRRYLLLLTRDKVVLFDARRPKPLAVRFMHAVDAAFAPDGRRIAVVTARDVLVVRGNHQQRLFAGAGRFDAIQWSPNGRWLLVSWPDADQWVFIRSGGSHRITAVSNISEQFDGRFPRPDGWVALR